MEFDDVADAAQPKIAGDDPEPSDDDEVAAMLANRAVMGPLMKQRAERRQQVLFPDPVDGHERPLPPAEGEVLDA